jgi:hypothetical protein
LSGQIGSPLLSPSLGPVRHPVAFCKLSAAHIQTEQGCALRIKLSKHLYRIYSSDTSFDQLSEAKKVCAQTALDQGVLDFIKHGNGQSEPARRPASHEIDRLEPEGDTPAAPLSLQAFYEALPKPFPESLGEKAVAEINAPGWLNSLIQSARGGKLSTNFIWLTDGSIGCK